MKTPHRFFEEAVEFLQSLGLTEEELTTILKDVYTRPADNPKKEAGDVYIAYIILCWRLRLNPEQCASERISNCWNNLDKIIGRQDLKLTVTMNCDFELRTE